VRFSDRTTLEGLFPATTQIPTLYDFIRAHLAPKYAMIPFTIYQTPPKRDLPEKGDAKLQGKTIKELGMAPQAIISIHWVEASMNGNTFAAPLDPSVLSQAKELPTPPSFDGDGTKKVRGTNEGDIALYLVAEILPLLYDTVRCRNGLKAFRVSRKVIIVASTSLF
jgi:tether containing UBX domain for GLUT4